MIVESLKTSILDFVLFNNISSDNENSKSLFEKINLERTKQIDLGIVKNKQIKKILINEPTKTIPDNWMWVRFNNIYNFIDYRGKTPSKLDSGIRLIGSANIKMGRLDFSVEDKYISAEEYETRKSRGVTKEGDLLFITEGGSLGNVCINDYKGECSCGQRVITFQQYLPDSLNNKYYMYILMSNYFKRNLIDQATGSAAVGIKGDKLKEIIFPLPPLKEQNKIVNKIEELFTELDSILKIENELKILKKEFPLEMKKSVLSSLFKDGCNIEKEKLGRVVTFENLKEDSKGSYNYLDVQFLRNGINGKKINKGKYIEKNSLAILMDGENSGELFKISEDGYLGSTLKKISVDSKVVEKYLVYFLELKKDYFKGNKRGAAIPHLNKNLFVNSEIYLPSKQEQQQIVNKIEELLPLLNDIEQLAIGG